MSASLLNELLCSIQDKLGQDVKMSDLEQPTSEFMMRYFMAALNGIGIDVMGMIDDKLQKLPNSDSYKHMIQYSVVFDAVWKVYPLPKLLTGLSLLSFMEPKPEDIEYVVAFDNFFNFWTAHVVNGLGPRIWEVRQEYQELKELKHQKEELQHKLNQRAAVHSKRLMEQTQVQKQLQELEVEVDRLQLVNQHLEDQLVERKRVVKEIRSEVESNRLKAEQQEEQQEAEAERRRLKRELQEVQVQRDEQQALLEVRKSALQDKASRKRFVETLVAQEDQITQAVVEHLQLAVNVETHMSSVLDNKKKLESVLKNEESEKTILKNQESQIEDMENEIAAEEKNYTDLEKQNNEHDRLFLRVSDINKEIASYDAKYTEIREKIFQKEQEFSAMENCYQNEKDKLVKKTESMAAFFKGIIKE